MIARLLELPLPRALVACVSLLLLSVPHLAGMSTSQVTSQDSLPSLTGTVRSDGAPGFLVGAIVEFRQDARIRRVKVGPNGSYRFEDLRSGPAEMSVFHLAAHPFDLQVELPSRGEVRLDLTLRHRVIPVAGLHVRAIPEPDVAGRSGLGTTSGRVAIGLQALDVSAGLAESGLASAVSADEPGDRSGVLYTHGSTVDARLILLDGAPILTPFHVAGLVEPFDVRLLQRADLYLGGAPSRYTGGVSYLLDVETRPAGRSEPVLVVGADGLTLDAMGETPLPLDGSLLFGGRLLHGLQESISGPDRFPYLYNDVLIRAGMSPAEGHDLRLTVFENREGVRLDPGADGSLIGRDAIWGNRAASTRYEGGVGEVGLDVTAAASRYHSRLPVSWTDPVLATGIGDRIRITGDVTVGTRARALRFGASIERWDYSYDLHSLSRATASSIADGGLSLGTTEVGVFGEWDGSLTRDLSLRAGARADRYSHEGQLRVSPRVELRWALRERVELFTAAGEYHQVLPSPGLRGTTAGDTGSPSLQWDPTLPVASASHLVVGLDQALDEDTQLTLSAFAKAFRGMGFEGDDRSRSSGTELKVSRQGDRLRGWFGYALSWFWVDEGPAGSTRFDGRHLLSMGMSGTAPGGIELEGTLGYGAGLPITAIGLPSEQQLSAAPTDELHGRGEERVLSSGGGGAPLELAPEGDFLRIDFEVAWRIEPSIGGHRTELRPYLKVLNALNRRDALFYYFDQWHDESARPLAARPVLPLLGLEWRF